MKKYLSMIFIGALIALAGCDHNQLTPEPEKPAEELNPSDVQVAATVSSLAFSWDAVEGVYQYTYSLTRDGIPVSQGVTKKQDIAFSNLVPSTRYLLTVTAFLNSGPAARIFSVNAATDDVIQLDKPSSLHSQIQGSSVTVSWAAVNNATSYTYTVKGGELNMKGTVSTNSVALNIFSNGEYTVTIFADSDDEAFSASETVDYIFKVDRLADSGNVFFAESIEEEGWGEAPFAGIRNIKVECEEGSIIIHGFAGVEGYDIKITYDEDENITSLTPIKSQVPGTTVESGYVTVKTGHDVCTSAQFYIASDYCYAAHDFESNEGYVLLTGYLYMKDGSSVLGQYYIYWPQE